MTINVPALRDRAEDLLPLARHFLALHARQQRKPLQSLAADAAALLRRYRWPGNIRELEHALERAVVLAKSVDVTAADLALPPDDGAPAAQGLPDRATLAELEKHWILTTLERHGGSQQEAADALGINRSTLFRKPRKYLVSDRPLRGP